jgi:hypothetical protein
VWRSGALLVMRRGARLPERCIRCGALLLVSVAVCGAGVITTGLAVQIAVAKKLDEEHLWIEKLGPRFLARLPEAPEALRGV